MKKELLSLTDENSILITAEFLESGRRLSYGGNETQRLELDLIVSRNITCQQLLDAVGRGLENALWDLEIPPGSKECEDAIKYIYEDQRLVKRYVDDPVTGMKVPTCHRSSFNSVLDDADYKTALENADASACAVYEAEANQIEAIRKGILEVSEKEEPYDIFICFKDHDDRGDRTLDSVLAEEIYNALTAKGYRVFFSRISLEDKLGVFTHML